MERQITILEQSKYEDFKAICDDAEGNVILFVIVGCETGSTDHVQGPIFVS